MANTQPFLGKGEDSRRGVACVQHMGWWPFSNKKENTNINDDIHIKGTNFWLAELRELCERNFDDFENGKLQIVKLKEEWEKAKKNGDLDQALVTGLELRVRNLLLANDAEWLQILDNEDFWKPGWRPSFEEE